MLGFGVKRPLLCAGLFPISTSIVSFGTTDSCSQELSSASPISHLLSHCACCLWDPSNPPTNTRAKQLQSLPHLETPPQPTHAASFLNHRYHTSAGMHEHHQTHTLIYISQQEPQSAVLTPIRCFYFHALLAASQTPNIRIKSHTTTRSSTA